MHAMSLADEDDGVYQIIGRSGRAAVPEIQGQWIHSTRGPEVVEARHAGVRTEMRTDVLAICVWVGLLLLVVLARPSLILAHFGLILTFCLSVAAVLMLRTRGKLVESSIAAVLLQTILLVHTCASADSHVLFVILAVLLMGVALWYAVSLYMLEQAAFRRDFWRLIGREKEKKELDGPLPGEGYKEPAAPSGLAYATFLRVYLTDLVNESPTCRNRPGV